MTVNLNTRIIELPVAAEIYISATPEKALPLQDQADQLFTAIWNTLRSKKAHIL
jgi:hypothetical protein